MKRPILASAAVAAVLLLAGCSAAGGSSSSPGLSQGDQSARDGSLEGGTSEVAPGEPAADSADGQNVITTGWITVTVDDPSAATEQAIVLVDSLDGRIDARSQQAGSDDQRSSAQLTVRVPADQVDAAIKGLKELGSLDSVSLQSSDVTLQVRDLDAQITALQASVDRLLALVNQAATTADLVELETAISDRQAQLDSLKSQKEYLADQIDYSTITLDLVQKGALPNAVPGDFWSGLAAGWASLVAALTGFVVVVGVLIPWLLPMAIIAGIIVLVVTLTRRRRVAHPVASGHGPTTSHHPAPAHPAAAAAPTAAVTPTPGADSTPPGPEVPPTN